MTIIFLTVLAIIAITGLDVMFDGFPGTAAFFFTLAGGCLAFAVWNPA